MGPTVTGPVQDPLARQLTIYVTSFSEVSTEATVSIGLKNVLIVFYKLRCLCCEAERVKSLFRFIPTQAR